MSCDCSYLWETGWTPSSPSARQPVFLSPVIFLNRKQPQGSTCGLYTVVCDIHFLSRYSFCTEMTFVVEKLAMARRGLSFFFFGDPSTQLLSFRVCNWFCGTLRVVYSGDYQPGYDVGVNSPWPLFVIIYS